AQGMSSRSATSWSTCGISTSTAIRTLSRCTSGACAAGSTSRSNAAPSKRFGAPVTECGPMAARSWHRLRGVRVRTTAVATLVVALALALGGALLVVSERASLMRDVTTTARLRAQDVAALLTNARVPSQLSVGNDERSLVQVVDASTGRVVAGSANIEGEQPISREVPSVGSFTSRTESGLPIGDSSFRVVAHT